ncbi:alpha/beta fold hydrolase [Nocardiopsis sediminis]|uniref:Alpha/beta fold hydrolase n=1 Tax=Nocardiopsis sediminis TaxID=1778267 RepID=A0ABV8FLB6_9ACTN
MSISTPPATTARGGYGAVTEVPGLPDGFTDVFSDTYATVDGVRLHAVVGGEGPPLLLISGWPQFWYQWRLMMPALAEDFTVVAVDPRGCGLSDKPASGYDSATIARELHGFMAELGHERFAVVGHDIGMWTGYAMAADTPGPIERLAVIDARIPGIFPSPPLVGDRWTADFLWHFAFNRVRDVNERLVEGREDIYFGHQFASKSLTPDAIPAEAVAVYVRAVREPGALRATFENYRDIDLTMEQSKRRMAEKLSIPVLGIGGAASTGTGAEAQMREVADDVTGAVIADAAHFVPEEAPEALLAALAPFLAPYRASA